MMKRIFALLLIVSIALFGACSTALAEEEQAGTKVTVSGAVEVEFSSVDVDYEGGNYEAQDLVTATVEVGVDAELNKQAQGHILMLWEEDETDPVGLDEATITLMPVVDFPLAITAGKYYLPFGKFPSDMISDPITLEIGEINQSAVGASFGIENITFGVATFNGDVADVDDDEEKVDSYVVFADFKMGPIEAGASYLTNIADTDGLEGEAGLLTDLDGDGVPESAAVDNPVAGVAAYIVAGFGRVTVKGEYVGALDEFEEGDLTFATEDGVTPEKAKPQAWFGEVVFSIAENMRIVARGEGSKDLYDLLPEQAMGATFSYDFYPDTTLSAEYMQGEFYKDNASGIEEFTAFTIQLALSF